MKKNDSFSQKAVDKQEYAELLEKFGPLIKNEVSECVRKLPAGSEYDRDELVSEAMMALYKAAQSYEDGKNVTFGLYAKICIHNKMISCARKIASRYRRRKREEERCDAFPKKSEISAEARMIAEYRGENVRALIARECSPFEIQVFDLYLDNKSYAEIAESVKRDVRSVGNAIYRVKRKLRKLLSSRGG